MGGGALRHLIAYSTLYFHYSVLLSRCTAQEHDEAAYDSKSHYCLLKPEKEDKRTSPPQQKVSVSTRVYAFAPPRRHLLTLSPRYAVPCCHCCGS